MNTPTFGIAKNAYQSKESVLLIFTTSLKISFVNRCDKWLQKCLKISLSF